MIKLINVAGIEPVFMFPSRANRTNGDREHSRHQFEKLLEGLVDKLYPFAGVFRFQGQTYFGIDDGNLTDPTLECGPSHVGQYSPQKAIEYVQDGLWQPYSDLIVEFSQEPMFPEWYDGMNVQKMGL